MNRARVEDRAHTRAQNPKLLAEWVPNPGENEYAQPALNPCRTTAYAFFTGDHLASAHARLRITPGYARPCMPKSCVISNCVRGSRRVAARGAQLTPTI